MKKLIFTAASAVLILARAACGNNTADEISDVSANNSANASSEEQSSYISTAESSEEPSEISNEPSTVSEEFSEEISEEISEIEYSIPDVEVPEKPQYNPDDYSPYGTEGATKIIIRLSDFGEDVPSGLFAENKEITDVYFEDGIKTIGSACFSECTSLKTVRLPETLVSFGEKGETFLCCSSLESIYIPDSVEVIGDNEFSGCPLNSVYLGKNIRGLGIQAFLGTPLTEVKLPDSLEVLCRSCLPFHQIKVLELPDNITSIWFLDCEAVFVKENSVTHETLKHALEFGEISEKTKIIFK